MEKSKNSRPKIHGLKIHTAGRACSRGPVRWWCSVVVSHVSKPLQSNGKQTTPKTAKDIFFIVFSAYRDMKNKRQKQDHRTPKKQK